MVETKIKVVDRDGKEVDLRKIDFNECIFKDNGKGVIEICPKVVRTCHNSTRHKSRDGETHEENIFSNSVLNDFVGLFDGRERFSFEPVKVDVKREEEKAAERLNNAKERADKIIKQREGICPTKEALKQTDKWREEGIKETNGKVDYSEINLEILDLMAERFTANKHKYPKGNMKKSIDIKSFLGKKTNKNKPEISLLFKQFPKALEAITMCSQYGHEKYKETDKDYLNYTRVEGGSKIYADAGLRHRLQQGKDLESGLPHQFHVAWNALAELQLWIIENE